MELSVVIMHFWFLSRAKNLQQITGLPRCLPETISVYYTVIKIKRERREKPIRHLISFKFPRSDSQHNKMKII